MSARRQPADTTTPLSPTPRTRLRRYAHRRRLDRAELYRVLDAGLLAFVGVVVDGYPRVIPMVYGRIDDTLYVHGSPKNQALVALQTGGELCVTVTNVDGLVLSNSMFHHSANFSSAMIYGAPRIVTDRDEKVAALRATTNQLVPGRGDALADPLPKSLAITMVIALSLQEASVKVREGPPNGERADYERDIWAGVLPLRQTWGEPETDPKIREGIPVPDHVSRLAGRPATLRSTLPRREPDQPI
jgi:nitroimidazol reductase NimA-like FMN-containing flavoprotein (pyridoxamine 5'-phosphate oxidase superfamily)